MQTPIDAISGTARHTISRLYGLFYEHGQQDDTEYIRIIRAVVEAAVEYATGPGQNSSVAEQLERELFEFSLQVWLEHLLEKRRREGLSDDEEQAAYYAYYYRHIYENGQYPR